MGTIVVKQMGINGNMRGRNYKLASAPELLVCAVAHQIIGNMVGVTDAYESCVENHVTHIRVTDKGAVEATTMTPAEAVFAAFTFGKNQPMARGGRLDKQTVVLQVPDEAAKLSLAKVDALIHKAFDRVPGLSFAKQATRKANEWFFDNSEFGLDCYVELGGTPKRPTITIELC